MTVEDFKQREKADNVVTGGTLNERSLFVNGAFEVGDSFIVPHFTEGEGGTLCTQYFGLKQGEDINDAEVRASKNSANYVYVLVKNNDKNITTDEQMRNNVKRLYPTLFHRARQEYKRDEFGIVATGNQSAPAGEPAKDFLAAAHGMESTGFRAMKGYAIRIKDMKKVVGADFNRTRLMNQTVPEMEYIGYQPVNGPFIPAKNQDGTPNPAFVHPQNQGQQAPGANPSGLNGF